MIFPDNFADKNLIFAPTFLKDLPFSNNCFLQKDKGNHAVERKKHVMKYMLVPMNKNTSTGYSDMYLFIFLISFTA